MSAATTSSISNGMISEKRAFELHCDILGDWVILELFEEGLGISSVVVKCRRGHGLFDTRLDADLMFLICQTRLLRFMSSSDSHIIDQRMLLTHQW